MLDLELRLPCHTKVEPYHLPLQVLVVVFIPRHLLLTEVGCLRRHHFLLQVQGGMVCLPQAQEQILLAQLLIKHQLTKTL